jgi:hypothetical protein
LARHLAGQETGPRGYRAVVSAEDLADPGWNLMDESDDTGIAPRVLPCEPDRLLPPDRTLVTDSGRHVAGCPCT